MIDRACSALSERGEGFEIGSSFGAVLLPDEATDASQALHVADERLYAQKHSRRMETDRTMDALLEALSLREPDLPIHLDSVGSLAVEIARALGLRRDEIDELVRAAQLHDLGKLAVPDEILHKAGPLDEREWAFVRQHPLVGERILRASPAFRNVATIVRSTHERWDGSGVSGQSPGLRNSRLFSNHRCVRRLHRDDIRAPVPLRTLDGGCARRARAASRARSSTLQSSPRSQRSCATASARNARPSQPLPCLSWPRSSVDRATDFESVCGGSTPPGATP